MNSDITRRLERCGRNPEEVARMQTDEERWYGERIAAQDTEDEHRANAETERLEGYYADHPGLSLDAMTRRNRLEALRLGLITASEYAEGRR